MNRGGIYDYIRNNRAYLMCHATMVGLYCLYRSKQIICKCLFKKWYCFIENIYPSLPIAYFVSPSTPILCRLQSKYAVHRMLTSDYFQSSSFSQFSGNPIALVSTLGWAFSKSFNFCLKSLMGWIEFCRYSRQQSWEYNFVGGNSVLVIQFFANLAGCWGICGKRLFLFCIKHKRI